MKKAALLPLPLLHDVCVKAAMTAKSRGSMARKIEEEKIDLNEKNNN